MSHRSDCPRRDARAGARPRRPGLEVLAGARPSVARPVARTAARERPVDGVPAGRGRRDDLRRHRAITCASWRRTGSSSRTRAPTTTVASRAERWWRAAHRTTWFDTSSTAGNPEDEAAAEVYMRSVIQAYSRRMEAALDESPSLPEWRDTGTVSDWSFVMDPAMTDQLQKRDRRHPRAYRAQPEPDHRGRPATRHGPAPGLPTAGLAAGGDVMTRWRPLIALAPAPGSPWSARASR